MATSRAGHCNGLGLSEIRECVGEGMSVISR